ncbi:ABC-type antimicrobial peptide transport system, ATPase component [Mesotoga prima MesG1.Ag.4.2]|uniref:ABC-type antimicrobial peptide transport system, ATPase component n=1 Tax=Mesotoga prima MesG1.Ag.4.2 TaxID=660470 RepID=I2F653_9BACT|nr:ABC transporter ATP-binding protein [Mesotoga prima]AFK07343.1 ABC-type antimicrobial peptide transport system, ATPase component [Mesotoga prima MesG1.Ag.4.2]AFK07406.1 ABC-type antimicrobial peptide transport system, ATPase component [Mesotoga prima MesG1.Ag.4.2]
MEVLKTTGLRKVYGSGANAVTALKGAELSVEEGEFIAIVGPSGSGKSTLLHLLAGLDRPTAGSVHIDGKNLYAMTDTQLSIFRRRRIGFVFQFFNLIPVLTARENIELPLILDERKVDEPYLNELIRLMKLEDRVGHLPSALSGGQQQRVAIARALITKPAIVFADEPTGNLDSKTSQEVMDLLKISARKFHQTLVIVTHEEDIAERANRIITLEDGEIVSDYSNTDVGNVFSSALGGQKV